MKKRLLSLLLCLTMLASVLPAGIFTISASAAHADAAATGAVISSIALTIPEPTAGEKMSYQASAPDGADYRVRNEYNPGGYWKDGIMWSNGGRSSGDYLYFADEPVFRAGKKYTVYIFVTLEDDEGDQFADVANITATVNGEEAGCMQNGSDILVFYTFVLPTVVDNIAITLPEPKAGEKMSYEATVPEDAGYRVLTEYNPGGYWKSGMMWSNGGRKSEDYLYVADEPAFAAGAQYTVYVFVTLEDEETCTFADEVTVTVNGNPAEYIARDHLVWYTLTVTEEPEGIPVRYHYMFPLPGEDENHVQIGATDAEGYVKYPDGMPDRDDEGYTFIDWYADEVFTFRFIFSKPVTEAVDLYARWVKDEDCCDLFIYLDPADEDYISGVDVPRGDIFGAPEDPGREGFAFAGWYTDRELTKPYDPTAPIMEDTNLFARWIEKGDSYILGDVDGDGEVTIYDASAIQRKIAGMSVTPYNEAAADVDGDGDVIIFDASLIQRKIAGMTIAYPIGERV